MLDHLPGAYSLENKKYDADNIRWLITTYNLDTRSALEYAMQRRYEYHYQLLGALLLISP